MHNRSQAPLRIINSVAPIRICDNGGWSDTWFAGHGKVCPAVLGDLARIEQMELLGHDFFLFHNTEEAGVNVLYRRHDGNYGLLVPELD